MMAADEPSLLRDKYGLGIQALGPYHASTATVTIANDTPQSLAIPAGTIYYELASVIALYIDADGVADASTSAVFPAGAAVYKVLPGQTAVSVKRVSTDTGPVTLTPMG